MCGRYVSPDIKTVETIWPVAQAACKPFGRRYNVLPGTMIPALRGDPSTKGLIVIEARWGFIPPWWKQSRLPSHCFTERSEDADHKPMWSPAFRSSRCLIPADGWYEWSGVERIKAKAADTPRQPHFIFRPEGPVCFAGVMSLWKLDGHLPLITCAILTRPASPALNTIHNRMPVVLPHAACIDWVDPRLQHPAQIASVMQQAVTDFSYYPVDTRLNNATDDDEALVKPIAS